MRPDFGYFTGPGILLFLITMTILVAAHEYGHYIVARLFGMDIEEFAIGFGKKIYSRPMKKGGEFAIRAIPLGGFVRTKGMVPEEDGSEVNIPNGFYSKSPFSRFCMLFAGPIASIIAGWVLIFAVVAIAGVPKLNHDAIVGAVSNDTPGKAAGLQAGDRIKSIDGKPTPTFFSMVEYVRDRAGQPLEFVYERQGVEQTVKITPVKDKAPTPVLDDKMLQTDQRKIQGKIGVAPSFTDERVGIAAAATTTNEMVGGIFQSLQKLVSSFTHFRENVGSPIAIVDNTSRAAEAGWRGMVLLAGVLSISMGIFNLLPISPLDGGQMLVAVVEMFRRGKRLSYRMQNQIAIMGLGTIAALFCFVFLNDVSKLIWR